MKKIYATLISLLFTLGSFAQYKYPPTKVVDSSRTYFGTTYRDDYGWLENLKDTAVISWFKNQAAYTNNIMRKISGRDELIAEWKMLDKLRPVRISGFVYKQGRVFYRKTMPGEPVGKLYYRQGLRGREILLFDPSSYIRGKRLTMENYAASYDGKRVAIAYSEGGTEVSTIKVLDVATRKFLPGEIYPVAELSGFTLDNTGIFYLAFKTADQTDPEGMMNLKTKLHILSKPVSTDIDFFSNVSYPKLGIESNAYPYVTLTDDNKNYIYSGLSTVRPDMIMWYAPMATISSPSIQWKVLCTEKDSLVRGMEFIGNNIYAISHDHAPNFKLLMTDAAHPDWKHARVVAAERKDWTLEAIAHSKDFLYETYSDGINSHIYQYALATGKTTEIKLPVQGYASLFCLDQNSNNCTVNVASWIKPYVEYNYNAISGKFMPGLFNKPLIPPAAYTQLEVKEVEVKGHDGTMIPLSIIYKKGLKLDGNNVCLMNSYGAYGISMTPYFMTREMALAVKGVVIAIPHVRGGTEKGQAWYKAGFKTTKPNTWKDFNSCAEYLIAKGYTQPAKLSGTGTSGGGIMISRAITERPDLWAAAICNVGEANAMRGEFEISGPSNIPEFGTVKDSAECRALYEMDGFQHVVKGTLYPAVICVGGWNDPRVATWQPGKFAAALQNASASGKPVLMKVNFNNGHFSEDKEATRANFADQFAFVMWQCGHPAFKLKD
jgi:prolyl oligopeptidase